MILLSKPILSVLVGFMVLCFLTYIYLEIVYKNRIVREIEEEFLRGSTGNDDLDRKIHDRYLEMKHSKRR